MLATVIEDTIVTHWGSSCCCLPALLFSRDMCLQLMSSTGTWYISSGSSAGDKERVATIKKDMFNNAHSASAFLQANNSQHFAQPVPDYSARGDINNRSFFIYRGAVPVAEVCTCARPKASNV